MPTQQALIIGAGPGGLAAAVALAQVGWKVIVCERADLLGHQGSGLTLWPNALRALSELGLRASMERNALALDSVEVRNDRGKRLFRTSLNTLPDEIVANGTGAALLRKELLDVLLKGTGPKTVQFRKRCVGFHQTSAHATATFEDGSQAQASLLVGADGVRSAIRRQLHGQPQLRSTGYTVWRGVCEFELPDRCGVMLMGVARQFGMFPMAGNRVYWFACLDTPQKETLAVGDKAFLLDRFRDCGASVNPVMAATDAAAILRHDVYDCDPLSRWSEGRVTLLGDAAHPVPPTLGQGACAAIEDAVVLARVIAQHSSIPAALHQYERVRRPRTEALMLQSRRVGEIGRWRSPLACWMREMGIRMTPAWLRQWQLTHMFRFVPQTV